MRRFSSLVLLPILVIASACSKNNYAQVEPDDLYFSHKDRKAAQPYYNSSATTASAVVMDSPSTMGTLNSADVSSYTSQHSPTLHSTTLGSPTIQQYEESFYDSSQNPDYLVEQDGEYVEGIGDVYYTDDYASYDAVATTSVPQTVNNYYGYNPNSSYGSNNPYSPYSSRYSRYNRYYSSPFYFSVGYGYNPYRSYSYSSYYGYSGYNDPFYNNNYYTSYAYCPINYGSSYNNPYSPSNDSYNGNNITNYYGESDSDYNTQTLSSDGTVTGPRTSRSSVSYYANKNNYDVVRRDNYRPGNESGRIVIDESRNSSDYADRSSNPVTINRRTSQRTNVASRKESATAVSGTIQRTSDSERRYRTTTVRRPVTKTGNSSNSNVAIQRQTKTYVSPASNGSSGYTNRSSNRQSAYNNNRSVVNSNKSTRSRYTSPSNSGSKNTYRKTTNSVNRSQPSNTRSRSSYTPSRSSSSPSRSSSVQRSAPSRSSSVQRSAPSRSSSVQRSSSKSSSGSTKSSSSKRKN